MGSFANPGARTQTVHRHHAGGSPEQARQLLGAGPDATSDEIRAAFAVKVKEAHPDAGGKGGDIQQLKQARNLLLKAHRLPKEQSSAMRSCQMCAGRGSVSEGFGSQVCSTCNGTGEIT